MWFFDIRKKEKRSIDEEKISNLEQLINRQEILELHENHAELRFWLPELCKQALNETVDFNQKRLSEKTDVIREHLLWGKISL